MATNSINQNFTTNNKKEKNGRINLKINNFKTFEKCSSPVKQIGNFKWRLDITKITKDKQDGFDANVFCDYDDSTKLEKLWLCKAVVEINVKSEESIGMMHWSESKCKNGEFIFYYGHTCHQLSGFFHEDLEDGRLSIEMKISIKRHNIQSSMTVLETDLQLLYNNGKQVNVAVNKHILAGISSYFLNLFFSAWSERVGKGGNDECEQYTIQEEDDFDMDAFKLMLHSAMALAWMVHETKFLQPQNVLTILKLSVKYDVPMLLDHCQQYVQDCSDFPKMELLVVAEQLGLEELKDYCVSTIKASDVLVNFRHNAEICTRLGARTQELLDARMKSFYK